MSFDTLHNDLVAMRTELRVDIARLEAKIDGKPSLIAMFTAILIVVFGMISTIGTAIGILASLHLFK